MICPGYAKFDPTGNITVLVLDPVPQELQAETARTIMREYEPDCEQVGFMTGNGMRMMGGEFCGNATMSAGCLIAAQNGLKPGESVRYLLEVSGADEAVPCGITAVTDTEFTGTVAMPLPECVTETPLGTLVRFPGIAHLLTSEKAEEGRLRALARQWDIDAAGMVETHFEGEFAEITPLVYVRSTDTAVFEHGCGSGSAAAGAAYALSWHADGVFRLPVRQPGGVITVTAAVENGRVTALSITGRVRRMKNSR